MQKDFTMRQLPPFVYSVIAGFTSFAMMYALPVSPLIIVIAGLFTYLPLFAVYLVHGSKYGSIAYLISIGLAAVFVSFDAAVLNIIPMGIPLLIAGSLLTRPFGEWEHMPAGLIVSRLAVYFLGLVITLGVIVSLKTDNPLQLMLEVFKNFEAAFGDEKVVGVLLMLPSFFAVTLMFLLILNAVLAQRLVEKWSKSLRPSFGLKDVVFPKWWDIVLVSGVMLTLTGVPVLSFMGQNIALVACVPLYFIGLSIVFEKLYPRNYGGIIFSVIVAISLLLPQMGFIVVLLGVMESAVGIRKQK